MSWGSWSDWLWSKPHVVLDQKRIYLKIQFLTQQEKIKKDIALQSLLQQEQNDSQTLIPYEQHYKCSYRFTFKSEEINLKQQEENKVLVKQIINNIILSKDQQTRIFYENYVNGIQYIMKNNESLNNNDYVNLYNETQISVYDPKCILEIVYTERSLWERLKNKTKQTIKKIPSLFARLVQKIVGFILTMMGLNGGITSLLWKSIPSTQIISFLSMIISMFFPALGPILGLTKLIV